MTVFPCIDIPATGANIKKLRLANGLTVRNLQDYFGFEQPQAIYKWQWGECLPSIDNLYALSKIFRVPIDKILVGSNEDFHLLESKVSMCKLAYRDANEHANRRNSRSVYLPVSSYFNMNVRYYFAYKNTAGVVINPHSKILQVFDHDPCGFVYLYS